MSNLPQFLPISRPNQPVWISGDMLSPAEVTLLRNQMNALHFRPMIVVLPQTYHVKDGPALASSIATNWKLGPHSLLVVYSPADKDVWAECGTFNSSAGVDPSFFKHDFTQRMSFSGRDGNLYAALDASLQDVDRVIIRSQAFATTAVTRQTTQVPRHHTHGHAAHPKPSGISQVLPAVFFALLFLVLIGRAMGSAAPRRRFDDPIDDPIDDQSAALGADVDRIMRVTSAAPGHAAVSPAVKARNAQIPMAEFKKRADAAGKANASAGRASAIGSSSVSRLNDEQGSLMSQMGYSKQHDHSSELKAGIDSSAARVRQEYKERTNTYGSDIDSYSNSNPQPVTGYPAPNVVNDASTVEAYVATFNGSAVSPSIVPAASSMSPSRLDAPVPTSTSGMAPAPLPSSALPPSPVVQSALSSPPALAPLVLPAPSLQISLTASSSYPVPSSAQTPQSISDEPLPINNALPVTPSAAAILPSQFSSDLAGSSNPPAPSVDLSSFSLQAASEPFADVLKSMGTSYGQEKSNSGSPSPLDALSSFGAGSNKNLSDIASISAGKGGLTTCPKCSEPKSKDFSFCLKCGFNF